MREAKLLKGHREVTLSSTRAGCPVCSLPARERRGVDAVLALGRGPDFVAPRFKNIKRRQVWQHLSKCLGGDALVAVARARGWITEAATSAQAGEGAGD